MISAHDETYLRCLAKAYAGKEQPTRAILRSTGEKIGARTTFGEQFIYPMSQGFPLLTTKRMSFQTIREELLWFLRGETNVRSLQAKGVHIWDEWADSEGNLGPIYGAMWRRWGEHPGGGPVDQIAQLIQGIVATRDDPTASVGRRLIVTAWDPSRIPETKLPPCHCFFQCHVADGCLDLLLYQRSADVFLGVPYNVASYAMLLAGLAHCTGLLPGRFIHSVGNLHLYSNHLLQAEEQLQRRGRTSPLIRLPAEQVSCSPEGLLNVIEGMTLMFYNAEGPLRGEVAV